MVDHLHHIDDVFLLEGSAAVQRLIENTHNITLKWDGAPSIVVGRDEGGLFVATKSYFNKTPIKYYGAFDTIEDPGLQTKMKLLYQSVQSMPLKEGDTVQGDLLFQDMDTNFRTSPGKPLEFQPNVLKYRIGHEHFRTVGYSYQRTGVAWHTVLSGTPCTESGYSIWSAPLSVPDTTLGLAFVHSLFVDATLEMLPRKLLVEWTNWCIKSNKPIDFLNKESMIEFMRIKQAAALSKLTSDAGRARKTAEFDCHINQIELASFTWIAIYWDRLQYWKRSQLSQLNNQYHHVQSSGAVLHSETHIEMCSGHEGFVCLSGDDAYKLVDRHQFSKLNFSANAVRGWTK